jgi:hypothetical protein
MKRLLLILAVVLCIISPALGITYCFDYVMYRVSGQDSNGLDFPTLIAKITGTPYNYRLIDTFETTDSMKQAYWLNSIEAGDIIFLGTDHVGYANAPFTPVGHNIDHYLQIKGQSGVRRPASEIEQYALHDDLNYFIASHFGKIPGTMRIYRAKLSTAVYYPQTITVWHKHDLLWPTTLEKIEEVDGGSWRYKGVDCNGNEAEATVQIQSDGNVNIYIHVPENGYGGTYVGKLNGNVVEGEYDPRAGAAGFGLSDYFKAEWSGQVLVSRQDYNVVKFI